MSKTRKIVSAAKARLGEATEAFKKASLAKKAGGIAGVGASLALAKKGGSAAVKTVRKHPVGTAVATAALAAVGAAVYAARKKKAGAAKPAAKKATAKKARSEEHTSELQSRENLVCRLLLEQKKSQRAT